MILMKKKISALILAVAISLTAFGAGVYASQNGWLNFTGVEVVDQSKSDVDKIMDILRQVNDKKITAEQAVKKLQEEIDEAGDTPKGLAKQNKELREEVKALKEMGKYQTDYINHLEKEVTKANNKADEIGSKTHKALEEAKTYLDNK